MLQVWKREPSISANVVDWHEEEKAPARFAPLPGDIFPALRDYLIQQKHIAQLYTHQAEAWQASQSGKNVVVVTGTASGKTLCYNLPVLDRAFRQPESRALYLFPTKALTQDQYQGLIEAVNWRGLPSGSAKAAVAVYDGDTPTGNRPAIRANVRLLLSNPDMLHTGILPHHTRWAEFFRHLNYVVIDEIHVYRGVFGSHIANLIRRLKRIAAFYGSSPQFILTSATIGNPGQLAERLIEAPVTVIDQDGSPHGSRHFLLYNPPIVQEELGIRASAMKESIRLTGDLLAQNVQTLLFCRARQTVEKMLMYLQQSQGDQSSALRAYRSGYLPTERREIESSLRSGAARVVVATNALELGIDIGSMDAVILVGYPGTVASTRQQVGRAGRKHGESLAVLVASSSPLDQYLMQHPEFLFSRSPEQALINPDNLLILLQHMRCAAFELPFQQDDAFGNLAPDLLAAMLELLVQTGDVHQSGGRYFWMADQYPAQSVSLRSSTTQPVVLQVATGSGSKSAIGEVDQESALWMVHPQAIYLQSGQMYEVRELNLENYTAQLQPVNVDFYTEPQKTVDIEQTQLIRKSVGETGVRYYGELLVTTQVVGYRRIRWYTHEVLGEGDLDLPPTRLHTTGYWFSLSESVVNQMRESGLWKGDANNYGPAWNAIRKLALKRDRYTCQSCGLVENGQSFHVHHKIPFRSFANPAQANALDNLVTLCPACHKQAEASLLIRSGLAGLSYVLHNLAPLMVMCDINDLGSHYDPISPLAEKQPAVVFYDLIPAGIGLSEALYDLHDDLITRALDLVSHCGCVSGCPSCVGPAGVNGVGGKEETLALLKILHDSPG